jgi:uncharacterized membrane protein YesL
MMNNFYYGKSGKGDYRKEDLPKNRLQLFFEMLKVRLSGLVRLNLLYMLVWLPAILLTLITFRGAIMLLEDHYLGDITSISDTAVQTQPEREPDEPIIVTGEEELTLPEGQLPGDGAATSDLLSLLAMYLLLLIPCIAITGPFTAGVSYVTRNWARDEHAFIWSDFKDAFKANWKHALPTSLITGIAPIVIYIGYQTYGSMIEQSGMFFIIPQVFLIVLGVIWSLMTIYLYPLMVTYQLTYRQLLKNALLLAVGRLPQSLALRIVSLLPLIIAFGICMIISNYDIVILITVALYLLFLYAFNRFVYASYTNAVFDRYINAHMQGVEVNRGLNMDADDDEDDDEP